MPLPTPARLVIFVHGSRDPKWRAPFERFVARLQELVGVDSARLGYMEVAEPRLLDLALEAQRDGVRSLLVLPFFMAAGGHVDHDIPRLAAEARLAVPGLSIELLPPIGEHPRVQQLMLEIAAAALSGATTEFGGAGPASTE